MARSDLEDILIDVQLHLGAAESDVLSVAAEEEAVTIAGMGIQSVIRGDEDDNVLGNAASTLPQTIYGGWGDDVLWGGLGDDQLRGEGDSDRLVGGAGNDLLDGGEGFDTVDYHSETGSLGIVVNLGSTAFTLGSTTYQPMTGTDTWGHLDTYVSIEMVYGSVHNDYISADGSSTAGIFDGGAGDDTITGGGAHHTLVGGAGNDVLSRGTVAFWGSSPVHVTFGSFGNGTATGQGEDTLLSVFHVIGSSGNDTIRAGDADLMVDGGLGNDIIYTGGGRDTVWATSGADTVYGSTGNDTIWGSASTVVSYETYTRGRIVATLGSTGRVDLSFGGATLWTQQISQIRTLIGTSFDDIVQAGINPVTVSGGDGNDRLYGDFGSDLLDGGSGDDLLVGGFGTNTLIGGAGNDTLDGSYSGNTDRMIGGAGNDLYRRDSVNDVIIEEEDGGIDTVETRIHYTLDAWIENATAVGPSAVNLTGNALDNVLIGNDAANVLRGGAGNDTMIGGAGDDVYYIDDLDDLPIELDGLAGGNDTAYISVRNFDGSKLANIENIVLVGDGSVADGSNQAPVIGGASEPVTLTVQDTGLVSPFSSVTITDDSPSVTVSIQIDTGTRGDTVGWFENLSGGSYDPATHTYTITGTAAQVTAAIQALQFNPLDRPNDAVGTVWHTNFTIRVIDSQGLAGTSNSNISLDSLAANRAPTLSIVYRDYRIADDENTNLVAPFTGITLGDTNANDVLTVQITLDAASKGVLVPTEGGTYDAETGVFTVTGTLQQVQAAVRALRFNPTDRPDAPNGSIEATNFFITVTDAGGLTVGPTFAGRVYSEHYGNEGPTAPVLSGGSTTDHAPAGTQVGTLSATDPNGDTLTFTFGNGSTVSGDGRFEIVNGAIKVRDPSLIQVSQDTTFTYTVVASDGRGGTAAGDIAITVADVNKAPANVRLSGSVVAENSSIGHVIGSLSATDTNGDALVYGLLDDAGGKVELVNNVLRVKGYIDFEQETSFDVTVAVSDGFTTVHRTLTIEVRDVRRENVVGNAGDNVICGGAGNDTLDGGAGNDTLRGGEGRDQLTGGSGADVFVFDTAVMKTAADTILDFSVAEGDRIYLSHTIFSGLSLGQLDAGAFVLGTAARDQDDRIIYDQATGRLFYDLDGTGGPQRDIKPVLFATLNEDGVKPALTHASFFVV